MVLFFRFFKLIINPKRTFDLLYAKRCPSLDPTDDLYWEFLKLSVTFHEKFLQEHEFYLPPKNPIIYKNTLILKCYILRVG